MLILYRLLLYFLLPAVVMRLVLCGIKDRRYFEKFGQRFGFGFADAQPDGIWVHAVSVGEVHAAQAVVEYLLNKYPQFPISITTMTPTGAERVNKIFSTRVKHFYLPYDYPYAHARFLKRLQPQMVVVMETEIWPNMIDICDKKNIPMVYINARLSRRAHRGYRRIKKLIAPSLKKIKRFAVQSRIEAKRLINLGARREAITIIASVKFDGLLSDEILTAANNTRAEFGARAVWIAGSTHAGEEEQILEAFGQVKKSISNLLLIIVPRHPQRFAQVIKLCEREFKVVQRSTARGELPADVDIYIGDTMGELPMLIAASDIAFIGGSLVAVGGHNVLEALAVGVPVIFGEHMFNFTNISKLLLRTDAGIQVMDARELAKVVERLLSDAKLRKKYSRNGIALIEKNRGALKQICALVEEELSALK